MDHEQVEHYDSDLYAKLILDEERIKQNWGVYLKVTELTCKEN